MSKDYDLYWEQEKEYQYSVFFDRCNEPSKEDLDIDRRLYEQFLKEQSKSVQEETQTN